MAKFQWIPGWKKDKFDARDLMHPIEAPLQRRLSLTGVPEVRDQARVGACVGFGIGGIVTRELRLMKLTTDWAAPEWIYNGARFIEGTLASDSGCEPGDALDWLQKRGVLPERFWPYNPAAFDPAAPSSTRMKEVLKVALSYFRVDGGAAGICSAIEANHCVSIGTPWFHKWMNPKGGVLAAPKASDTVDGGHETYLYAYDLDRKTFIGRNSWSASWGLAGDYVMPFSALDVFKSLGGYDAQYVMLRKVTS